MNTLEALEKLVDLGVKQKTLESYCGLVPGKITEILKKRTQINKNLIRQINTGINIYLEELKKIIIDEEAEEICNWCVYIHTFPNEKKYIGISMSPLTRWKNDGSGYKEQTRMWGAIQKYGWDNIKHEIILKNLDKTTAKQIEKALISQYQTTIPALGYNSNC